MRLRILLVGVVFLSATFSFSYQEVKELNLTAAGIKALEIKCGAGSLEVVGREGLGEIQVTAEIVVKGASEKKAERFVQERMKLSLEKIGGKAVLVSKFKQPQPVLFSFKEKAINLTVNVPKKMPLRIDDGSGWLKVGHIEGNIVIDDGSGSVKIEDIIGKVEIDDGSGSIQAEKIEGDMEIDDGSGEVEMKNVAGDVWIDDGSGNIEVRSILGSVSIVDGSGSIYVEDVQGDVEVSDGSGSINVNGVERDVIIKRAGSGSVNIRNVKGKISK
ncbi:MAG: DUF4097 family beta strand repeat protein [Candidatus Aminicenantes bacterium]|nr:DUF4097 family beta strand repeat protein [Candidatus Aminicenantes bacterium]